MLVERKLLPGGLLEQMMSIVPDNPPAARAYGLGLIADPLPCGTVWGHSGDGFGYDNRPFLRRETGRFAVFMLNGTYGFRLPTDPSGAERPGFSAEMRAMAYA